MDFSELYKLSTRALAVSPSGRYIATAIEYRLVVRDATTLQIVQLFTCLDVISEIRWDPESRYVLCAMHKRALVQIWSVEDPEWSCKIDEGSAGLVSSVWSPDGRHVLNTADFALRITVWSLVSRTAKHIRFPKDSRDALAFSHSGVYLAVLERRECKDFVGVFATDSWEMVSHFAIETTDATEIVWSPDDRVLAVRDTVLEYRALVYTPDGRLVFKYSAYENALGIRSLAFSPSRQFLAIGSFDQKMRLINTTTWKVVAEQLHSNTAKNSAGAVYVEDAAAGKTRYILADPSSVQLTVAKANPKVPNPKVGVSAQRWSADGQFLATRNENVPNTIWIWDIAKLALAAVLVQSGPVKSFRWDPTKPRLAVCIGTPVVFLWTPAGCSCVDVPAETPFKVTNLQWNPDGASIALLDAKRFCVAYDV